MKSSIWHKHGPLWVISVGHVVAFYYLSAQTLYCECRGHDSLIGNAKWDEAFEESAIKWCEDELIKAVTKS